VHVPEITTLAQQDPELAQLIEGEAQRQHDTLRMIASENYVSRAVLEATGTVLTNKYSEGYPGKRYYGGNHIVDEVEDLEDVKKRLEGYPIAMPERETFYGMREVGIFEPGGHTVIFAVKTA